MQGKTGIRFSHQLFLPPFVHSSLSPSKSSSPRASLLALSSLLDLLHLPALRQHRQHLAPASLERLLRLAPLLREASEEEEVSLHAGITRRHGAPLPCSTFSFPSSPFLRRWRWPYSRSSGCRFAFMRPRWPVFSRLAHGFPPLHISFHSPDRSLTLSLLSCSTSLPPKCFLLP